LLKAPAETFHVELIATNPLNAPLVLADLTLVTDQPNHISIENVSEVTLAPYERRAIQIPVTATSTTIVSLSDVSFLFHRFFPCSQSLQKRGKRLHATKAERITPTYADATALTVDVGAFRPQMTAELAEVSTVLYAGEEVVGSIRLMNTRKVAVEDVRFLPNRMGMIRVPEQSSRSCSHGMTPAKRNDRRYRA